MFKKTLPAVVLGATLLAAGCNTSSTTDGALLGGALGAGLGAVVGNQSGHAGEGALIGAGAGALTGGVIGNQYEKQPTNTVRKYPNQRTGHYETRVVRTPSGETYEERILVQD